MPCKLSMILSTSKASYPCWFLIWGLTFYSWPWKQQLTKKSQLTLTWLALEFPTVSHGPQRLWSKAERAEIVLFWRSRIKSQAQPENLLDSNSTLLTCLYVKVAVSLYCETTMSQYGVRIFRNKSNPYIRSYIHLLFVLLLEVCFPTTSSSPEWLWINSCYKL